MRRELTPGKNNSQSCRNRGEGGELKPRARPSIGASRSCDVRRNRGELFEGNRSCSELCETVWDLDGKLSVEMESGRVS